MRAVRQGRWVSRDSQVFKASGLRYVIAEIERLGPVAHRGRPEPFFALIESTRARRAWDRRNRRLVRRFVPIPAWPQS